MPSIEEVTEALRASWDIDTCFDASEWSQDNPARGQCVASALVVQQYLGGELMRYKVTADGLDETHYCNVLADGTILDTTGSQYRQPVILEVVPVDLKGYGSVREKRLSDEETRGRYEILEGRVAAYLAEKIQL